MEEYESAMEMMVHDDLRIREDFEDFANHVWYCFGNIYFKTKQYKESIKFFSKAVRERPEDIESWIALGNAYSENKMFREASHCFFAGYIIDNNNDDLLFNYSNCLIDSGEYEKALYNFRKIKNVNLIVRNNIKLCQSKLKFG